MASIRYICTNGYRWMITCFVHVYGFSQCYNEAEKASIPAALMCYNNHVVGPRVVLDVFRAKESSTTECVCTVTSDTPTKFHFFNYNNYHPGVVCGSVLIFSVNGDFHLKQCFVDDMELPSSNLTDTSVDISINVPKSAISTDYCVLIESATSIPSKAATMSSKEVPSTYNPKITTVQSQSTAAPSSDVYLGYSNRSLMMAPPRCVSFFPWMICVLISLIERPEHVVGYSTCYNDAEQASIPAALMCYNNDVVGPRVVLDVFRAKDSSTTTTDCVCTVTSDTPTKFNFSNYNNYHPGTGCGSTLIFSVNGNFHPQNCYVDDTQLPSSNLTDTSVDISINGPKSAISTDYCVLIESDVALNISCTGDSLSSLLTTQSVSTTETTITTTKEATTQQTTSQTLPSTTDKLDTTTSIIVTTLSQSTSLSTNHPIATTEETYISSTSSLLNSSTTRSQTIDTTEASTVLATLEITSVVPNTTEKVSTSTYLLSSTDSPQTTTQMSSTSVKQETTTITTTNSSTESGVQDTTTIVPPLSSTESGAQDITTTDTSKSSTSSGEQQTTTNATTLPSTTNNIQMTSISVSTESSTINVTQQTTVSIASPPTSTHGVTESTSTSSVSQKATTVIPVAKTTFRQATAEVPWNGIIPAVLIGVILLAALLIVFIKWQRSREIKYPPDSSYSDSVDSSNKYPQMGETNFGYDAYEDDSGIVTEFSKSPEELEIEYEDEGLDPKNLTKGTFIRYNVQDYSRNIDSVNYNGVTRQVPNGMDVYF
uniref:Uncharacterized protein n=1 Tax=Magallana gigas TaxID=29159 RepID=A0A8W8JKM3_MAGGI